jgi:hypothetical protein
MSDKKFSEETLNIVQDKLNQAKSVAVGASITKDESSEQFVMFIYEKLQQEEFIKNSTLFTQVKNADLHIFPGGKDNK